MLFAFGWDQQGGVWRSSDCKEIREFEQKVRSALLGFFPLSLFVDDVLCFFPLNAMFHLAEWVATILPICPHTLHVLQCFGFSFFRNYGWIV